MKDCAYWDEEKIDGYVRRLLEESEAEAFEDHVMFCPSCQDRAAAEWEFAEAARVALLELGSRPRPASSYVRGVMSAGRNAGWTGI